MTAPAAPRGKTHARTNTVQVQESARLELVIPQASDLNISEAIARALNGDETPVATLPGGIPAVAAIAQRNSLFYGSRPPIYPQKRCDER